MQIVLGILAAAVPVTFIAIVIKAYLEQKSGKTSKLGRAGNIVAGIVMLIVVAAIIAFGVVDLMHSAPSDDPWENVRM